MKTVRSALMILVITGLAANIALAKRGAPKDVAPVKQNGIVYSAPHDQMGFVVAKDEKSGNLIFSKQIYVVKYDPNLEKDVQDCFITELRLANDKLIVDNERDSQYELNLATLAVKATKGAELIEKKK
jgi:hypothetical protein